MNGFIDRWIMDGQIDTVGGQKDKWIDRGIYIYIYTWMDELIAGWLDYGKANG